MEFSVVLLVGGGGSRLHPVVVEQGRPKALLPVCNRPLIFYQLFMLEQAGFDQVVVVASDSTSAAISSYLAQFYSQDQTVVEMRTRNRREPALRIESLEDGIGTADALRAVLHLLKGDHVVVVSGDTVTNVSLNELTDLHRVSDADLTMLLKEEKPEHAARSDVFDFVGIPVSRLKPKTLTEIVLFESSVDVEEALKISRSILRHKCEISIRTDLSDPHIYVFSRPVLDILHSRKSISSIKYQLVPFLIRNQFKLKSSSTMLTPTLKASNRASDENELGPLSCRAWIVPPQVYARRVNTIASFLETNREVAGGAVPGALPKKFPLREPFGERSTVSADSIIGSDVRMGDRSSLKKSIVGDHCSIGNNVKITNSIIMDHVTIADGCQVAGSVVCENCHIQSRCTLRDCQVGESVTVAEATESKGEDFTKKDEGDDLFY